MSLAAIDCVRAAVVLDIARSLNCCLLVNESVPVDLEGPISIARVLNGGRRNAGYSVRRGGTSGTSSVAAVVATVVTAIVAAVVTAIVSTIVTAVVSTIVAAVVTSLVAALVPALAGVIIALVVAVVTVILPVISIAVVAGILAIRPTVVVVVSTIVATIVVVVVAAVVTAIVGVADGELGAVILGTSLGNRHENGLMVGGTGHRANAVIASGETARDSGGEDTLTIALVVDTLEEDKLLGAGRVLGSEVVSEVLDGDVGMTDDAALAIQILRSRVVRLLRVGERTGRQVLRVDDNVKRLVFLDRLPGLGVLDDRSDHAVNARNPAHDDTVARTLLNLETVGQGLARTEVDEVVVIGSRRRLPILHNIALTSGRGSCLDNVVGKTVTASSSLVVVPPVVVIVVSAVVVIVVSTIVVVVPSVIIVVTATATTESVLPTGKSVGDRGVIVHDGGLRDREGAKDGEENVLGKHFDGWEETSEIGTVK